MSAFHDVSFPLRLAFGASGGPVRSTQITTLASGGEHRNAPHAHSKRLYNAAPGIKSHKDLQRLVSFFEARHGQLYSFRFKDPVDHLSCELGETPNATDQILGVGDGEETEFQLYKAYGDAAGRYARKITKPVQGSVIIAVGGLLQEADSYEIETQTGRVTFQSPPALGAVISAGFEFDVAVRFASDRLDLSLESFGAGEVTQVPLTEVRDA